MGRQMFARGGQVYPMQDGGMAPPMAPPPQQGPAPQMPGMMAMGGQEGVDINAAAQGAMQQGIDPTILEGLLGNYASQMEDLDNAQDYETVMNGIRGDQIPVEGRYAELAEVVGQEDAQATPESVLTLLQPVMMMAAVDQGIGGLAQDEMSAPIEGAMAEGIMSTVNMGAPEGPAPVNFNQGGAVLYMAPGGVVPSGLQSSFDERQSIYNTIIGPQAYDQADIDAERNMTQAQMLFDVAGTALAFATPGDRQMSPGQRLAQAATDTQLFEKIGARAKDQMTTDRGRKKDMRDEKMKIDLMALEGAEAQELQTAKAAAAAAAKDPTVQQFMNTQTKELVKYTVGSPGYVEAMNNPNLALAGDASQSGADRLKPVNFYNPETNKIEMHMEGSPGYEAATAPGSKLVLTGAASQTPPSSERITLYNAATGETLNPLKTDPSIDELLRDGFTVVSTPPIPTTLKLDARTIFVSDNARLTAYANGTLNPSETTQLEQIIGEMQIPSTTTVEGQQVTMPAKPLSRPIVDAIRKRMEGGHRTTAFNIPEKQSTPTEAILSLRSQPDNAAVVTTLQLYRNKADGTVPKEILNSTEFNSTLLDASGRTDLSSESWRMIPTQIYNAKTNYDLARGPSTVLPRAWTALSEISRDFMGNRVNEEGMELYQADNDFNALRLKTIGQLSNIVTEDRVLKSVQDAINETLAPLKPGVFGFDAKARTTLTSISGLLAMGLDEEIAKLPEYGGDPSLYSNTQVQQARQHARALKGLLAEYVQFGDQMDRFLSGETGVGGTAGQNTQQQTRNILYTESQKQLGGEN
jgi:hypothetical protein